MWEQDNTAIGSKIIAAPSNSGIPHSISKVEAEYSENTNHMNLTNIKYPILGKIEGVEKAFLKVRSDRESDLQSAIAYFLEFLRGFESLDFEGPCVTVFGSARFAEDHIYYKMARELGGELVQA